MTTRKWYGPKVLVHALILLSLTSCTLLTSRQAVPEMVPARPYKILHTLLTSEFDLNYPSGMAYLPNPDGFLVWDAHSTQEEVIFIGKYGTVQHIAVSQNLTTGLIGAVFDPLTSQLLLLQTDQIHFLGLTVDKAGSVIIGEPGSQTIDISSLLLSNPAGFTRNPANGDLYILDAHPVRIFRLSLGSDPSQSLVTFEEVKLSGQLHGLLVNQPISRLAFNPETYSLYTAELNQGVIYDISMTGNLLSKLTLDPPLGNVRSLIFAPGVNQSEDLLANNLFILDGGKPPDGSGHSAPGQILEITLHPTKLPIGIVLQPAYLVRELATSKKVWTENSPDPSGIAYFPETGELIVVDSEVDEFEPKNTLPNVFYLTSDGRLDRTANTYKFSTETSGIAVNPLNNHYYFCDDNVDKVFELDPGPDNTFWTVDDVHIGKAIAIDAEDIAFGNNTIFVAGGNHGEILSFGLGADGVLSADDELPVIFNTHSYGFSDLEGIAFNQETGTLFIVSTASTDTYLGEFSLNGRLLNAWDLAFMGKLPNLRSGLVFAPASADPSITHIYIVSRGVDNNADPQEDDGKVIEISLTGPAN